MASNDSDAAAVTAVVNAVAPTLTQTESKAPKAAQESKEPPATQSATTVPVAETPLPTPMNESKSESAVSVSSCANIPSIPPVENTAQPAASNSIKDVTPKETNKESTDLTPSKGNGPTSKETVGAISKEDKPQSVVEKKPDQEPMEVTQTSTATVTTVPSTQPAVSVSSNLPTSTLTDPLVKNPPAQPKPVATIKPMVETSAPSRVESTPTENKSDQDKQKQNQSNRKSNNKRASDDVEEGDKRIKSSTPSGSKGGNKTPEQVLEYMEKTFDQRRKMITKQMPTIPELKSSYPELFKGKQLLLEFQRITKIDIDQKIQEFCVRYATAVIEMARSNKAAAPVLARWEKAKQENESLKQYWDMVTALCLLPLHFGENFVEMVLEIEEDEEVKAQGKIVPTLVARGNIFCTDEFFLIAENTIVQEFEEFTIAFASLYSSYWVFNMVYPETVENTYNYIQRCIVRQREPGAISSVCKNFTKSLQKWNKEKEGKVKL